MSLGATIVRTGPCPRCQSLHTETTLRDQTVLFRACADCLWSWNWFDDRSPHELGQNTAERLGFTYPPTVDRSRAL